MERQKAPVDGKNVTTDWIESIFDEGNYVQNTKGSEYAGFVSDKLVIAYISDNTIVWRAYWYDENTTQEIIKRLEQYETDDSDLYSEMDVADGISVTQYFWWKND